MNILAIDIGGTTTRFAAISNTAFNNLDAIPVFKLATQEKEIKSFDELLIRFFEKKSEGFSELNTYDVIALSVPGPVYGHLCIPPNIPWRIDINRLQQDHKVFMINDFAAQAYACLIPIINKNLMLCRQGKNNQSGRVAIIGAGTGLGHCTLINVAKQYHVLPSECGHATFSFVGQQEQAFGEYLKQTLNVTYCVNDHIVNGRGISLLHEFLTQQTLTAEQIFSNTKTHQQTISLFSRFYGRVARNYCLTNCIDDKLILSGGLVAKNPELITDYDFFDEFTQLTTEAYRPMLDNLSVATSSIDEMGVYGVAYYAAARLKYQH